MLDSQKLVIIKNQPEINSSNFDITNIAESPINFHALCKELSEYNSEDAKILFKGFKQGFKLQYSGPRVTRDSKNLRSIYEKPAIVQQKIEKEIKLGRVAGPFMEKPLPNLQVSPIGLVPKKLPGEYRLIHHLSYPESYSINDFIDPNICSVQYTNFDEAVYMLQDLGQGCKLFKVDIKSAFRLLPVCIEDIELLGFKYKGQYYVDKCLPFGCSISCSLFEKFSTFLELTVKKRLGSAKLIHYN